MEGVLDKRTKVDGYGDHAFSINGVIVRSSVILLPKQYFLWNVNRFEDIHVACLRVFPLLVPTVEVLLIGCGQGMSKRISPDIVNFFKQKGIYVEAISSASAASTFNVLNGEDRNVAAALLTMLPRDEKALGEANMNELFPDRTNKRS